ncbi:MAG TPA: phage Gp37/Gp68 family protein [Candidatus Angelobacter sp.]
MSEFSSIEWTDATWNPVRGCSKISQGCKHCYAETFAERFRGVKNHPYERGFDLRLVPEKLAEPVRWRQPRKIFVNSMSDLFHEEVPDSYIRQVVGVMLEASWHVYQVLTKRAERLADFLSATPGAGTASHIWWGASVENKKSGVPRIQHLRRAPIRTRFLSVEPLLEDLGKLNLEGISWVIVGGESGRDARPMKREWVIAVRDQCRTADVPFFFKQWGGKNKRVTGRELDGTTHDEYPASETTEPPSRAERERLLQVTEAAASAFL